MAQTHSEALTALYVAANRHADAMVQTAIKQGAYFPAVNRWGVSDPKTAKIRDDAIGAYITEQDTARALSAAVARVAREMVQR